MKICLLSDTHNLHDKVELPEGCDVLVHAGDLTVNGSLKELGRATAWLNSKLGQFHHVIAIGGNHDFALEHFINEGHEALAREFFGDVTYLRDSSTTIDGVKFYGSPWCPQFADWAFNMKRGPDSKSKWSYIPDDTEVLITHTPPYGILDYYWQHRLGCEDLMDRVKEVKPLVHVFGHIHGAYGEVERDGTKFFNAAITDIWNNEEYRMGKNKPFVVEV